MSIVLALTLGLFVLCTWFARVLIQRRTQHLPPHPQSFGQIVAKVGPKAPQWVILDSLKDQLGPIFSFYRGSTLVVVINKADIAWDLLQKRGDIYSSRPRLVLAHEIVSGGMRGLSMPYGKQWRTWRKIQNTGMSGRASLAYCEHQALESTLLLRGLLHDPERYEYYLALFATSVVLSIAYGRRASNLEDPIFKRNAEAGRDFQQANIPGNPVDKYPALLYLPRALQWFRRDGDKAYARAKSLYVELLEDVKDRMATGTAKECMATRGLKDQHSLGFSDLELAFALSAPFGAGIDTTSATLEIALCAILHSPASVRKAQEELDRVVGRDRLPTFDDEPSLPYLHSFITEIYRWHTVVPLAVPHSVTADDVYNGYFIPKGATVIGNLYTMLKDPEMFPEPDVFRPERFADAETQDSRVADLPFGFGRRHCAGMHVAQQSIYIVVARILWAFDVEPVKDEDGKPILPDMSDMKSMGLTRKPAPFRFSVRPRFPEANIVVEKEAAEAEKLLQAWE
ncbi:cytochrome P450 [Lentinus tigrinus ALCF2SS1-7]|uniref:Cytochrome P450 n=1 Tax=Lentinus tigrinus ALCF2SS1-6 TaxID=1328759 RepID=A0A5C2RTT3_9APHY|nr:cytochrome P450 [Lentinus tigrinus ALCF2SS1-6]RPD70376.1 cytochrome P450 [Lentinus tigrinus ALCF2SS1-7]